MVIKMKKKNVEEEMEAADKQWYEVFGMGRYGPSVEIDHKKMLRFQGHVFLNKDIIF